MQNHLSRAQLAARLGRATGTVAHWARDGIGPKFIRVAGGRVAYRLEDVEAWERAHTHESTASIDTSQQQAAAQASVAARRAKREAAR